MRPLRAAYGFGLALTIAALLPGVAEGAAPQVAAVWATDVTATSAKLHAEISPGGASASYHFEYLTEAAYQANVATNPPRDAFAGAAKAPAGTEPSISTPQAVAQSVGGLAPQTAYRYRAEVKSHCNPSEPAEVCIATKEGALETQPFSGASPLLDGRAWELVSPADKNGGQVGAPETIDGGGDLQAAAGGEAVTFSSEASFGNGAAGAPPASQYLSTRTGAGWVTRNVTPAAPSGSYGDHPDGAPYRIFSTDLSRALMLNGSRCGEGEECPRSYSLLEPPGTVAVSTPAVPGLRLAGAAPDLRHVVFGDDGGLYEWSGGALEALSAEPGAALAAPSGAISADGSRVYWYQPEDGPLWLHEAGGPSRALPETTGVAASFQVASADGSFAFYTSGGTLYRYSVQSEASTQVATEVKGVLGASQSGAIVFYQTGAGLYRWAEGSVTELALGSEAAAAGNWPPATGTARVSADGSALAFVSGERLTGYDNTDQGTGKADSELFLWRAGSGLTCVSCNPTGERPIGPASMPGAVANGTTQVYKPRDLVAGGHRLFFDSADALVLSDTNGATDAYEWEAGGTGGCADPGGCLGLVSSGRSAEDSAFVDASESGADVFFLTTRSLVSSDPGSLDLYDAREGGGFPEPTTPIACEGDTCQTLPSEPEDPQPGTLLSGPGNPALRFPPRRCPKGRHRVKRHGQIRCVPSGKHGKNHHRGGGR